MKWFHGNQFPTSLQGIIDENKLSDDKDDDDDDNDDEVKKIMKMIRMMIVI